MPFVVVFKKPGLPLRYDPKTLESACKEAWVAMKQYSDAGPFEAVEVGGLLAETNVINRFETGCDLLFCYTERPDRGIVFREDLRRELKARLPEGIVVNPVPTESWFTDPVWAVKEIEVNLAERIQI